VRKVGGLSAALYAANRPRIGGVEIAYNGPDPGSGEHPWLGASRKALTREDLATLMVRGYENDVVDFRW
jgi:hypothetical protein